MDFANILDEEAEVMLVISTLFSFLTTKEYFRTFCFDFQCGFI